MGGWGFKEKSVAEYLKRLAKESKGTVTVGGPQIAPTAVRSYLIMLIDDLAPATYSEATGKWTVQYGTSYVYRRDPASSYGWSARLDSYIGDTTLIKATDIIGTETRMRVFNFTGNTLPKDTPLQAVQDVWGDLWVIPPISNSGTPLLAAATTTIEGYDSTNGYTLGEFNYTNVSGGTPTASIAGLVSGYNMGLIQLLSGEHAILLPNGDTGNYLAYPTPRMMLHKFGVSDITLTTTSTVIALTSGTNSGHGFATVDDVVSGYIKFLCKGYYDIRVDVNYIATDCNFPIGPDAATSTVTIEGYNPSNTVNVPEHPGGLGSGSVSYNFIVSVDVIGERLGFKSNIYSGDASGYLSHFSVLVVPKYEIMTFNGNLY